MSCRHDCYFSLEFCERISKKFKSTNLYSSVRDLYKIIMLKRYLIISSQREKNNRNNLTCHLNAPKIYS